MPPHSIPLLLCNLLEPSAMLNLHIDPNWVLTFIDSIFIQHLPILSSSPLSWTRCAWRILVISNRTCFFFFFFFLDFWICRKVRRTDSSTSALVISDSQRRGWVHNVAANCLSKIALIEPAKLVPALKVSKFSTETLYSCLWLACFIGYVCIFWNFYW